MRDARDSLLREIYYDLSHPASFGGIQKLYDEVKRDGRYNISRKFIKEWLMGPNTPFISPSEKKTFLETKYE